MSSSRAQPDSTAELDALLDDALEGFDAVRDPHARDTETESSEAEAPAAAPQAADEPGPQAKAAAFDPLGRRGKGKQPAAPGTKSSDRGDPNPEDMEAISMGISKLLAELAGAAPVEDAGNAEQRSADPSAGPPSGADFNGDLAATLRALAEQQPDLGGPEGLEGPEGEMLEKLMAQLGALPGMGPGGMGPGMEGGADLGDDGDGADGMSSVVNVIMQQLLSKEVLYQPMKDIGERYPSWLEANRSTLDPADVQRYEEQQQYIAQICTLYETDPQNFPKLMDLLHEMQQRGQPPQEIVDELAPGMSFGPDGLPSFDAGGPPGPPGECCLQ